MNLKQAREKALKRLEIERRKATPYEQALVAAMVAMFAVRHSVEPSIWRQLDYDLRIYPLYDALAMWLDEESGLASAAPEMMVEVARLFLDEG